MSSAAVGRFVRGASQVYEVAIGLEVHVQLATATKLFSGAPGAGLFGGDAGPVSLAALVRPNEGMGLFDVSHPGAMPAPNAAAISAAVRTGLALRGEIAQVSRFVRKHYFYADLPHGYQVTQLEHPIVARGSLAYELPLTPKSAKTQPPSSRVIRIERLQLEVDTGKSSHELDREASLLDFNRAGVPLLEIVTAPDLRSAEEAGAFLRALAALLRAARVSDAAAEEGGMRADVNVSLRRLEGDEAQAALASTAAASDSKTSGSSGGKKGKGKGEAAPPAAPGACASPSAPSLATGSYAPDASRRVWRWAWDAGSGAQGDAGLPSSSASTHAPATADPWAPSAVAAAESAISRFGPRVELKNLSSIRAVERSIACEAARQAALLDSGARIERETRLFDAASGASTRLRGKEDDMDYRFMAEPDVAPLLVPSRLVRQELWGLPELPAEALARLSSPFPSGLGLDRYDASVLTAMQGAPAYLARVVTAAAAEAGVALGPRWSALLRPAPRRVAGEPAAATAAPSEGTASGDGSSGSSHRDSPSSTATSTVPELIKACANWVTSELFGRMKTETSAGASGADASVAGPPLHASNASASGATVDRLTAALDPQRLGSLVGLVLSEHVSGKAAKGVLDVMMGTQHHAPPTPAGAPAAAGAAVAPSDGGAGGIDDGDETSLPLSERSPRAIVRALGWGQISDPAAIEALVRTAILQPLLSSPPDGPILDAAARYVANDRRERVLPFLVSRLLAASGGRANPALASAAVRRLLEGQEGAAAVTKAVAARTPPHQ